MLKLLKKLGPGLLYAAAAIGVSHLVQSTRAGASFGHQLLWAVALANILKYPFFKIGPVYTTLSGKSLLEGYKEVGPWALPLVSGITLLTMFTVIAAITVVTSGIALQIFNISLDIKTISTLLLGLSASVLIKGKYNILDNIIKVIIIVLTLSTIASVLGSNFVTFPKVESAQTIFSWGNRDHVFFLMALIGWMPAPLDVPIWHSLWTKQKQENTKEKVTIKDTILDFKIGYIGTMILAFCFLILGANVLYMSGVELQSSAGGFAGQLIKLYTSTLGPWSYPIIAISAFATMFSTTLTCLDAFPRLLTEAQKQMTNKTSSKVYPGWLFITIVGATGIIFGFMKNMKSLVDFATIISFLVAPIFAFLNYKVMKLSEKKYSHKIGTLESLTAISGITFITVFSVYFLFLKLDF